MVRIDHFRGFDEYYSIPVDAEDASMGHWEPGPGIDLFLAIRYCLGDVQIIAEDLGHITESVKELVRETGFPSMKVLEFAFDSREEDGPKDYLPYNYDKNCVVYTGTHDNETLMSWTDNIKKEEVGKIKEYTGKVLKKNEIPDEMLRMAISSTARICIIPIQDYLGLGDEARINTPSTVENNWQWRLQKEQLTKEVASKIKRFMTIYGRI
jgi:4-alpha-glucanotransferase